jgi:hypothetical protein
VCGWHQRCQQTWPLLVRLFTDIVHLLACRLWFRQVASLEFLRGQPSVVPLLDYGVTTSISGVRQWVLIFPRYAGSMREWRVSWAGRGLNSNDLPVYLSLFLQVSVFVGSGESSGQLC